MFKNEMEVKKLFLLRKFLAPHLSLHTGCVCNKIVPDNLKRKSKSSQEWLTRQINDVYVKKSRYDRYRCRSAYKLLEIDEKFNILKPNSAVIDCGAAPGSWTQVVLKKLKINDDNNETKRSSIVIAVDLQYIYPLKGAVILSECDFTNQNVQDEIFNLLPNGKADVVLSDMAPKATGTTSLDSAAIMSLIYSALRFSMRTLSPGGTFLCKAWDSNDVEKIVAALKSLFNSVKRVKPKASRSDSSEIFLLAMGFKGKQNS